MFSSSALCFAIWRFPHDEMHVPMPRREQCGENSSRKTLRCASIKPPTLARLRCSSLPCPEDVEKNLDHGRTVLVRGEATASPTVSGGKEMEMTYESKACSLFRFTLSCSCLCNIITARGQGILFHILLHSSCNILLSHF